MRKVSHKDEAIAIGEFLARKGLIRFEVSEGTVYTITAEGIDEVEGNKPQEAPASVSNVFNIQGNVYSSVIGTHNTAELTASFDFRSIESQIEREGGEDEEELREALAEVRRLLESDHSLERGALSRFSGVMQRHEWFTGSVTQALLGFATQAVG